VIAGAQTAGGADDYLIRQTLFRELFMQRIYHLGSAGSGTRRNVFGFLLSTHDNVITERPHQVPPSNMYIFLHPQEAAE
jgi:hypothetical protein